MTQRLSKAAWPCFNPSNCSAPTAHLSLLGGKRCSAQYHYLGFTTKVGRSISYLAVDRYGRPVGCLLFGACDWKTASRDRFIGWDSSQRCANMHKIANNMRFLIPPFVRGPHLASHLLSLVINRLRCHLPVSDA